MILSSPFGLYAYPTGGTTGIVGQIISLYPKQTAIVAFEPGNDIPLACEITVGGIPTDPPSLTLRLENPTGAKTTQTVFAHDGTGLYHYDLYPAPSGTWFAEWDCPAFECSTGPIEFSGPRARVHFPSSQPKLCPACGKPCREAHGTPAQVERRPSAPLPSTQAPQPSRTLVSRP